MYNNYVETCETDRGDIHIRKHCNRQLKNVIENTIVICSTYPNVLVHVDSACFRPYIEVPIHWSTDKQLIQPVVENTDTYIGSFSLT